MVSDMAETTLPVSFVPTGWASEDGGAEFKVDAGKVIPYMGSRAYFALECNAGKYDPAQYMGLNLLGRTLSYTVDLSGAGCGCNAAFYLTSMNLNKNKSVCGDYYCDANNVCGQSCAEIDIQEANEHAWHSTLHTATDHSGVGGGFGGGGKEWSGPRDWTAAQYAPGGKCIDTSRPFVAAASFPVNASGWLTGMIVELSQAGHSCKLSTQISLYVGMAELSHALGAGMTPIVSYWRDKDMRWMDGQGQDGKGPCKTDSPSSCSESVKFYNFSIVEMPEEGVPVAPVGGPGEQAVDDTGVQPRDSQVPFESAAAEAFCCLAATDQGNFCGSCPSWARADPNGHCGKTEGSCVTCGGAATWCAAAPTLAPEPAPASASAGQTPTAEEPPTPTPESQATPAPEADAAAHALRAPTGSFCCLASLGSEGDFCKACFPEARVGVGSMCGNSSADCTFCGGQATWCEESRAENPWGLEDATPLEPASSDGESDDHGHCCLAAMEQDDVCGSCFSNAIASSTSKCGRSRDSCEGCGGGAKWCFVTPDPMQGGSITVLRGLESPPAEGSSDADPFDCKDGLANWEVRWSHEKKSWCCQVRGSPCPDTAAAENTIADVDSQSPAPSSLVNSSHAFCCMAAMDVSDVCGSCFDNAIAQPTSHCGRSEQGCKACGGMSTWCMKDDGTEKVEKKPVVGNASSSPAGFCCLASQMAGSHFCDTCFANARAEPESHCGKSKGSCEGCGGVARWCEAAPGGVLDRTAAAAGGERSGAPKPTCPGKIDLQSDDVSPLPAQIVPTGWGSEDGGAPVRVEQGTRIHTSLNARAYFAESCEAGSYSNEDYLALNLLGKSLQYTVDLGGAGCGCNAALYLTSMRQNTDPSSCSDFYCDANSVCGVACAEIDIQEANMHSWHSTLHTENDTSGVGGGFGGGGKDWSGPRDWNSSQYSPGGTCIDTKRPFIVVASFPVDSEGSLAAMEVILSQDGKPCTLAARVEKYEGMAQLSRALDAGMTPIVSYWSDDNLLWMDGRGKDNKGACKKDHAGACSESVRFYNFSVGVAPTLPPTASPTAEPTAAPSSTSTSTAKPTASSSSARAPSATASSAFCCLASPDADDFCGSCPDYAKAPPSHPCAKSESECQQCGGMSRWCATASDEVNGSAQNSSSKATMESGAKGTPAEAASSPSRGDLRGKVQDKYLSTGATWEPQPSQPSRWLLPALATCPALVALLAALAGLPRMAAAWHSRTAMQTARLDAGAASPMLAATHRSGPEGA